MQNATETKQTNKQQNMSQAKRTTQKEITIYIAYT